MKFDSKLSVMFMSFFIFSSSMGIDTANGKPKDEFVILLHGMGRTKLSMKKLERYLIKNGYQTINVSYPSTRVPVKDIAEKHIAKTVNTCRKNGAQKIHFVTHSLGGIVLRMYLQDNTLPEGSRVVMLSPPNKGSEVVDVLKDSRIYEWVCGPAGLELGTDPDSIPNRMKPIGIETGIITGNKSLNPVFSSWIRNPNDGKVSIENSKLNEMTDFIVVQSSHSFIMRNADVMRQTAYFIEHGRFKKKKENHL